MTGVTIPHMVQIARRHGLVPVPLDLDPLTLAPSVEVCMCGEDDKSVCM